jgi:hypothetical protein
MRRNPSATGLTFPGNLATASPREGLIDYTTVAVANFALWRLHTFNQLVQQLTDFNTAHMVEITSEQQTRLDVRSLHKLPGRFDSTIA